MKFNAVGKAYVAQLSKLTIQVLLLLVIVLYLIVVTSLEVGPVEWRDRVCGLVELIGSILVVIVVVIVIVIVIDLFDSLSSVNLFAASFAGDLLRCLLTCIFGGRCALATTVMLLLGGCSWQLLARVLSRVA